MNKKFLQMLLNWPKSCLTGADLLIGLDKSACSRQAIIKRALQEEVLARIRRDLYLIKIPKNRPPIDAFEAAPIIYGPSYISFESALSVHSWIPEAVPVITNATTKRSKDFDTPIGIFSYHHIPISAFHMGLEQRRRNQSIAFIADPWKAVADLIYVQNRSWESVDAFCNDMRVEKDKINQSDMKLLEYLSNNYPNQRTQRKLKKVLNNAH